MYRIIRPLIPYTMGWILLCVILVVCKHQFEYVKTNFFLISGVTFSIHFFFISRLTTYLFARLFSYGDIKKIYDSRPDIREALDPKPMAINSFKEIKFYFSNTDNDDKDLRDYKLGGKISYIVFFLSFFSLVLLGRL